MRITKDTTDETLHAGIAAARKRLQEAAADDWTDAVNLASAVNTLASAEGRARIWHHYRAALQAGQSVEEARAHCVGLVLNGPDDGWSGRTNDARRAVFDGMVSAVRDL